MWEPSPDGFHKRFIPNGQHGHSQPGDIDPRCEHEHTEHVHESLRIIQEAQSLSNEAARELCPVHGFADEWSESVIVHDAIKAYWHQVNSRLMQLRRDGVNFHDVDE